MPNIQINTSKKLWIWLGPVLAIIVIGLLILFIGGWAWPGWFIQHTSFSCQNCGDKGICNTCCVKDSNGINACIPIDDEFKNNDINSPFMKSYIEGICKNKSLIRNNKILYCNSTPTEESPQSYICPSKSGTENNTLPCCLKQSNVCEKNSPIIESDKAIPYTKETCEEQNIIKTSLGENDLNPIFALPGRWCPEK